MRSTLQQVGLKMPTIFRRQVYDSVNQKFPNFLDYSEIVRDPPDPVSQPQKITQ